MATQVKPKCFQGVKDTFKQEQLKEPKKAILGEAYFWAILIGARFCMSPSCDGCFTGCRIKDHCCFCSMTHCKIKFTYQSDCVRKNLTHHRMH